MVTKGIEMTQLEKAEQQLKELTTTIEQMKAEAMSKQWEPKGGRYFIDVYGSVQSNSSTPERIAFGVCYQTKEQAEWASRQMRKFNRLLCYVAEHTDGIPDCVNIDAQYMNVVSVYVPLIGASKTILPKIQSGEVEL